MIMALTIIIIIQMLPNHAAVKNTENTLRRYIPYCNGVHPSINPAGGVKIGAIHEK